uniref:Uncharacterized protein n=1 Tax=Arundo donax TaxID=35708 RepID=A0A0A8ZMM1_ARUDO
MHEGSGCYILTVLRRSCRERRGDRSRRDRRPMPRPPRHRRRRPS